MNQSPDQPNTTPEVISSTQLQRNIGETMRRVFKDKQHLIVERDGLPVLVMLPIADYEALKRNTDQTTNQ